jgi:HEPN domain-containing protein
MKDETKKWLEYAAENLESAHVLLNSGLLGLIMKMTSW